MLKTSLLITGDASTAKAAVEELSRGVKALGASGKEAASGLAAQTRAETETAAAAKAAAAAQASFADELRQAQAAASGYQAELRDAQATIGTLSSRVDVLETRLKGSSKATRDATGDAARHAQATRNLGQQFGDLAIMIQGGISPGRAFATQAGQMGYAMSDMGGKAGAVGRFLVGPWGIALTIAGAALAPVVEQLFQGAEAAKKLEIGASGLADAQSALGQVFDLTTGKLKTQNREMAASNELLRLNIRLTAINLRTEAAAEATSSRKALDNVGKVSIGGRLEGLKEGTGRGPIAGLLGLAAGSEAARFNASNLSGVVAGIRSGKITSEDALRASERLDFSGSKTSREDFQAAIRDAVSSTAKLAIAEATDRSLTTGRLDPSLRQPGSKKKNTPSGAALAEFGSDAGDKIANIVGQFDAAPAIIDKANAKVRELDDLIEDLGRRKPAGFAKLVEQAEAAKVTVRSGLIRELAEGFDKPKTLADKAILAFGQLDAVVADLERRKPPGFEQLIAEARTARGAIEAGLNKPLDDFLQAQRESAAVNDLLISGRLVEAEALRSILALEKTRGGKLLPEQRSAIIASTEALRLQERQLERIRAVQQVNLDALADIRDIARQTIFEGPQALAKLPERLFASFKNYNADRLAEEWLGDLFRDLRDKVTGASKLDAASATVVTAFNNTAAAAAGLGAALDRAAGSTATTPGGEMPSSGVRASSEEPDVVVTGRKRSEVYGDTIAGVLGKIGIGKDTSKELGKYAGKAMAGALEGQTAAGVAGMFGIKTSGTGSAIGGALGGLTGLPGGSIVGGILGGVVGKLLGGKPKEYGSSTISIGDGAASASVGVGKGAAEREAASALGGSVAEGLNRIAEALGGSLSGSASVSIGYRPGHKAGAYRVDTTGAGRVTGVEAFESEAEAVAFAIRDAMSDGAIAGLSSAVQKALSSSADVDKAVAEAIKVQDLENALGGPLATYQKAFRAFETQAADRVRIATKYGFDVVAIEKRNADERIKLAEQLARAQTGSIQSLVDEITRGSLFEGTALDKIAAIDADLAKAKADLDSNVEGAGDRFAALQAEKLAASKDAYGTTGGYAAIRNTVIGESQAAIARVNAQVMAAQQTKSDPALTTTNATLDEMSDQNAQVIATLKTTNELLAGISAGGGGGSRFNLAQLALA